jgi:3-dehydroquinate dehydratase II
MANNVYVLNGPNLNRLGKREPHIYGHETLEMLKSRCLKKAAELGIEIDFRQTNFEGVLIESVHEAADLEVGGIIINPAGLTFTSVALMDALKMFDGPKVELHITNVHQREPVYHDSLVSAPVTAVMAGFGTDGYLLALEWIAGRIARS